MSTYDLAVVGGGYAGLACAASASARGLKTVVLDRKPQPGARPHTTGILVKEVADEWDVPRHLTRKIHAVRLYAPSGESCDLTSPGYYFLATNTSGVLQWLARRADTRGTHLRFGKPVREIRRTSTGWGLDSDSLEASWLVGADGAKSVVARTLGLGINRKFLVGVEHEYTGITGIDECLHVFVDSSLAPGYIAWVVPGVSVTQVGLACNASQPPDVPRFLDRISTIFDLRHARLTSKRRGLIPVGGLVRRRSGDNVMLIGDAAGMVSPLTAGGIQTSLQYGRQAGVFLADHLLDGGPDPVRSLDRCVKPFGVKHALRWGLDRRPPNWMLDLALRTPVARAFAQTVFYHHRGLLTQAAWKDLVGACFGHTPSRMQSI
ncbi:MAG: NAD(P)/FAD-dependent oxidoreductase [Phycisphaerales bacterium JB043]